jgi:hypothetical protein
MAIVDITTWNDADFYRGFVYQTTDTVPVPIDLTGNTMRMGIRHRASDVTEEILLTTENGGLMITDAVNGKFTVWITQAQLLELPLGGYEHSLIRIDPSGLQRRIWSGSLVNNAGASRGTNT